MTDQLDTEIHDIDIRLRNVERSVDVIESSIKRNDQMRKWIYGIALTLLVQFVGGAMALTLSYAKLTSKLEDISAFRSDTSTVLAVLGQHGDEFTILKQEIAAIHMKDNTIQEQINLLNRELNDRTKDRWYKSDAMRSEERMKEWVEIRLHKHSAGTNGSFVGPPRE